MNKEMTKRIIFASAKRRLAEHKALGKSSILNIHEVAELLDIVAGINISNDFEKSNNISFNLN